MNNHVLSVSEALYPLREQLARFAQGGSPEVIAPELARVVRQRVQQEVGGLLVYDEAIGRLEDQQRKLVAKAVDDEIRRRISMDFGGSDARFEQHLAERCLTREQYRRSIERRLVVADYTRQKLIPKVQVNRDDLLEYHRQHSAEFATPETRELLMIEAPFDQFAPQGASVVAASPTQRAAARLAATRHIRAAHAALDSRPFEEVAREYSRGLHAENGGSWGPIGKPLQPPYDELSSRIFAMHSGQHSEPIETPTGWYIVKCGGVNAAQNPSFAALQSRIRERMIEERYNAEANAYVLRLADQASISSLDDFLEATFREALREIERGAKTAGATRLRSP